MLNNLNFIKRAGIPYNLLIQGAKELNIPLNQRFKRISEIAKYLAQKSNAKQQSLKAKEDWMKGIKADNSKQEAKILKNVIVSLAKEIENNKKVHPKQMEFKF